MRMKLIIFILINIIVFRIWAFPVIDTYQVAEGLDAIDKYAKQAEQSLERIAKAKSAAEQLANLKSLQQLKNAGAALCQLCSPFEQQQLEIYIQQVDNDLCSQFQYAMDNAIEFGNTIKSIADVINIMERKNPKVNPKVAMFALQHAAVQASVASANTLNQIQMLIAQQEQKKLAQQKMERQVTLDTYSGFKNSGL